MGELREMDTSHHCSGIITAEIITRAQAEEKSGKIEAKRKELKEREAEILTRPHPQASARSRKILERAEKRKNKVYKSPFDGWKERTGEHIMMT